MRLLLDTHTLLFAARNQGELSPRAESILLADGHSFYVSAASAWELATKVRLGKLADTTDLLTGFENRMTQAGYSFLSVSCQHGLMAGSFPQPHKDPFDRMLAAQARVENLTLLSNDKQLDTFGIERLW